MWAVILIDGFARFVNPLVEFAKTLPVMALAYSDFSLSDFNLDWFFIELSHFSIPPQVNKTIGETDFIHLPVSKTGAKGVPSINKIIDHFNLHLNHT